MSTPNYYDQIAASYNELHGKEQLAKAAIVAKMLAIKKSELILDVGCGTGLASSLLDCRKIGIDTSEMLLKQAAMPTVIASAEQIPFPDKSFDHCVCISSIHNFANPRKALSEMIRVTKRSAVISVLRKSPRAAMLLKMVRRCKVLNEAAEQHDIVIHIAIPKIYKSP